MDNDNYKPLLLYNIALILIYSQSINKAISASEICEMIKPADVSEQEAAALKTRIYSSLNGLFKAGKLERNWVKTETENTTKTEYYFIIKTIN